MNRDDIIRMAREAGAFLEPVTESDAVCLERFASLVIANNQPQSSMAWQEGYAAGTSAEREACAKVCDDIANAPSNVILGVAVNCAAAIRARGTQ